MIGFISAFLASIASAHFDSSDYTKSDDTCRVEVDPVNVVFHGRAATADGAFVHVHHHGWDSGGGRSQAIRTHTNCIDMSAQRASASVFSDRNHIRFFDAGQNDVEEFSVGDAHHEMVVSCGHAVDANGSPRGSGFDRARRRLQEIMSPSHDLSLNMHGNDRNFEQCNGWMAGSNGYRARIRIGA